MSIIERFSQRKNKQPKFKVGDAVITPSGEVAEVIGVESSLHQDNIIGLTPYLYNVRYENGNPRILLHGENTLKPYVQPTPEGDTVIAQKQENKIRFNVGDIFSEIFPSDDLESSDDLGQIISIEIDSDGSVYYNFAPIDYMLQRKQIDDRNLSKHNHQLTNDVPTPQPKFWPGQYVKVIDGEYAGSVTMVHSADFGLNVTNNEIWIYNLLLNDDYYEAFENELEPYTLDSVGDVTLA